jgi:hypothetical protein
MPRRLPHLLEDTLVTTSFNPRMSRRSLIRRLAVATGAAVSLPLVGWPSTTRAQVAAGTASKSALQYQDHPKGTSACANCANFLPGNDAQSAGKCTIVAGDISPKAWCLAYAGNG